MMPRCILFLIQGIIIGAYREEPRQYFKLAHKKRHGTQFGQMHISVISSLSFTDAKSTFTDGVERVCKSKDLGV